jgi:hypothetical protein
MNPFCQASLITLVAATNVIGVAGIVWTDASSGTKNSGEKTPEFRKSF